MSHAFHLGGTLVLLVAPCADDRAPCGTQCNAHANCDCTRTHKALMLMPWSGAPVREPTAVVVVPAVVVLHINRHFPQRYHFSNPGESPGKPSGDSQTLDCIFPLWLTYGIGYPQELDAWRWCVHMKYPYEKPCAPPPLTATPPHSTPRRPLEPSTAARGHPAAVRGAVAPPTRGR